MSNDRNDVPEIPVKEISEILDVVSTKVPKLISDLMKTLYSEETGRQMGKAVGALYKEIVDAGLPKEDALEMAKDYMNTLKNFSPEKIINK